MNNWVKKTFKISLGDIETGEVSEKTVNGLINGLFGVHKVTGHSRDYFALTHLATGYKVANWINESAAIAAGNYLIDSYKKEFDAIKLIGEKPKLNGLDKKILKDKSFEYKWHLMGVSQTEIVSD